jgi:hypothetical protein
MSEVDYTAIPGPERQCVVCGRDLATIAKHPSVLNVGDQGNPERRDICGECWEKGADRDCFSFWLTQREPPKPDTRQTRAQHRLSLMRLFEQFRASGDARFKVHIYVLAHILMKHRQLLWEGSETDDAGVEQIRFRNPATDETVRVPEIHVDDEAMLAVKREIDAAVAVDALQAVENETDPADPNPQG